MRGVFSLERDTYRRPTPGDARCLPFHLSLQIKESAVINGKQMKIRFDALLYLRIVEPLFNAGATHLLHHKVNVAYIAQLLGHRSLNTTQQYLKIEIGDLKWMHALYHPRER